MRSTSGNVPTRRKRYSLDALKQKARSFFDGQISYPEFVEIVKGACERDSDDPELVSMAYDAAKREDDSARRLVFAGKLADSGLVPHLIAYGTELLENLMPEKAEESFKKALQQEPDNVDALNGLGLALKDEFKAEEAAETFDKSLRICETELARNELEKIDRLMRNKKEWDEYCRKAYRRRQDEKYYGMAPEQQQRRIAEIVASFRMR